MKSIYVEGLSGQQRLLAKLEEIRHRGAPEASWLMACGEPGYGKSKALFVLAMKQNGLFIRAKANWKPLWMLNEIAEQLGVVRKHNTQSQFETVLAELMVKQPLIVVDEIDYVARKMLCIETLRDITDMSECVMVVGGTRNALELIKSYKQSQTRIYDKVEFGPVSDGEIATIAEAMLDVKISDDLIAIIAQETAGRLRAIMNALARVELAARKLRVSKINAEAFGNRQLTNEKRSRLQLVAANNG